MQIHNIANINNDIQPINAYDHQGQNYIANTKLTILITQCHSSEA